MRKEYVRVTSIGADRDRRDSAGALFTGIFEAGGRPSSRAMPVFAAVAAM